MDKKQINISLDKEIHDQLKKRATKTGVEISEYVKHLIAKDLKEGLKK
ncbi:plasmid partition protein ParG [Ligilactobacillus sp. LYQ135]